METSTLPQPAAPRTGFFGFGAIRKDCEAGIIKGGIALDWGHRGEAPIIKVSGKPALKNRIHLPLFEPIWHSAAKQPACPDRKSTAISITISRQLNQKPR